MKHFTFKQIIRRTNHFYSDRKTRQMCVKPDIQGIGEFITIGNRNPVTVLFIASPELTDNEKPLSEVFGLSHPVDIDGSMIQYNSTLGGYLYTWLKFD